MRMFTLHFILCIYWGKEGLLKFFLGKPLATRREIYKIIMQLHFNINKWIAFCDFQENLTEMFYSLPFPCPQQRCNGS